MRKTPCRFLAGYGVWVGERADVARCIVSSSMTGGEGGGGGVCAAACGQSPTGRLGGTGTQPSARAGVCRPGLRVDPASRAYPDTGIAGSAQAVGACPITAVRRPHGGAARAGRCIARCRCARFGRQCCGGGGRPAGASKGMPAGCLGVRMQGIVLAQSCHKVGRASRVMEESGVILYVDNAVQASIILLAVEGGKAVAGRTQMRMMVFLLLKKVGSIAGRGLAGTDAHMRCDSGDVDAELRRLSDAGAIRCAARESGPPRRAGRLPTPSGGGGAPRRSRRGHSDRHQEVLQRHDRRRGASLHPRGVPRRGRGAGRARDCRAEGGRGRPDRPGGEGDDHHGACGRAAAPWPCGCYAHGERGRNAGVH